VVALRKRERERRRKRRAAKMYQQHDTINTKGEREWKVARETIWDNLPSFYLNVPAKKSMINGRVANEGSNFAAPDAVPCLEQQKEQEEWHLDPGLSCSQRRRELPHVPDFQGLGHNGAFQPPGVSATCRVSGLWKPWRPLEGLSRVEKSGQNNAMEYRGCGCWWW
jgi:hypothetical protein